MEKKGWSELMQITEDRIKHSLAVAKKMKSLAIAFPKKYKCNPDEAFVLGWLHDIGYEFSSEQSEHAKKGGLVLKIQNYKYWKEIYYHGISQNEYDSDMLRLLNYVDMLTGPDGAYVTIDERIKNITLRYGENSVQETDAKTLADKILTVYKFESEN